MSSSFPHVINFEIVDSNRIFSLKSAEADVTLVRICHLIVAMNVTVVPEGGVNYDDSHLRLLGHHVHLIRAAAVAPGCH